ncbi:hypothetical protein QCA50_005577 [Cerrena zonata]|uniref:Uncharacterized protein n=1 Tax=Cerrena zonata TaxID=2478898 RepID=A0AAW0GFI7_9APHY
MPPLLRCPDFFTSLAMPSCYQLHFPVPFFLIPSLFVSLLLCFSLPPLCLAISLISSRLPPPIQFHLNGHLSIQPYPLRLSSISKTFHCLLTPPRSWYPVQTRFSSP